LNNIILFEQSKAFAGFSLEDVLEANKKACFEKVCRGCTVGQFNTTLTSNSKNSKRTPSINEWMYQ